MKKLSTYIVFFLMLFFVAACYVDSTEGQRPPDGTEQPDDKDDDEEKPQEPEIDARIRAYDDLYSRYLAGESYVGVREFSSSFDVIFADTTYSYGRDCGALIGTPYSWPKVTVKDDVWSVDGVPVGLPESDNPVAVAALYDSDGFYVWFSDGGIIFFHEGETRDIARFFFDPEHNPSFAEPVEGEVSDSGVSFSFPVNFAPESDELIATVIVRGSALATENIAFSSGSTSIKYPSERCFTYLATDDSERSFVVTIDRLRTKVPVMYITVDSGAEVIYNTHQQASMRIEDYDYMYSSEQVVELGTEIRGHGNSTYAWYEKKPYKLKLNSKTRLFGMNNSKHWILLANHGDKTLFRNAVAFEISEMTKMTWTNEYRFVELYVNGDYKGLYMITESNRAEEGRAEITMPTDGSVNGDFYVQVCERRGGYSGTTRGLPLAIKNPDPYTWAQRYHVQDKFNQAEDLLYAADPSKSGYEKYIDIPTFAAFYILQELTKNVDGNMRLSTFLTLEGEYIKHSNSWDFDISLGNCNYFLTDFGISNGYEDFHIRYCRWYIQLFKDPAFVAEVKAQWAAVYANIPQLLQYIDDTASLLDDAQKRNFTRWPVLGKRHGSCPVVNADYPAEITYLKNFVRNRADWLNAEISKM